MLVGYKTRRSVRRNMSAEAPDLLRALLAHLQGAPLGLPEAMGLVVRWLVECDRGAALEGDFID